MDKEGYVLEAIKNGYFEMLSNNIAIGVVYKIPFSGNLISNGIEKSFLYIPAGSGIKYHPHFQDIEVYRIIRGNLSVYGKETEINICGFGASHGIDVVTQDTIIETCKMNELFLGEPLDSYYEKYSSLRKGR